MAFSRSNLRRLFQLEISFDSLNVDFLNQECWLLPFSAKANALKYAVVASDTKDLNISVYLDDVDVWSVTLISFFNRVADLGHFERWHFSVNHRYDRERELRDADNKNLVVDALIRAIKANPKLEYVDVSDAHWRVSWNFYFRDIFNAMEEHTGLRTFIVNGLPLYAYGWLEQLLSRNWNITVCDRSGKRCTNGGSIDKLYLLNAFYNGSTELVKEPPSARSLLVATALYESASKNFQYSALLLSNHTDMLCEFAQHMN